MTKQSKNQESNATPQSADRSTWLTRTRHRLRSNALLLVALALPGTLLADPAVIRIDDVVKGQPVIEVIGAPNGYNIYIGPNVRNPAIEDGALITLLGVDTGLSIPDQSGRFVDPKLPSTAFRNALDIVWIEHDFDFFGDGSLRVGFNSALPGTWYANPAVKGELNFGPVQNKWITVYSNPDVIVQFRAQKTH